MHIQGGPRDRSCSYSRDQAKIQSPRDRSNFLGRDLAQFECLIDGVKCSGYKVSISNFFIEVPGIGSAPIPGTRTKNQIPGDRCNF